MQCHEIEHDGRDDLQDTSAAEQHLGDGSPQRSGEYSREEHRWKNEKPREITDERSQRGARGGTGEKLSFGTDVPDARAKGQGDAEASQQQRCRAYQRRRYECVGGAEGTPPERHERSLRIIASEMQNAGEEGER